MIFGLLTVVSFTFSSIACIVHKIYPNTMLHVFLNYIDATHFKITVQLQGVHVLLPGLRRQS